MVPRSRHDALLSSLPVQPRSPDPADFHGWVDLDHTHAAEWADVSDERLGWRTLRGSSGALAVGPEVDLARAAHRIVMLTGRPWLRDPQLAAEAAATTVAHALAQSDVEPTSVLAGRYAMLVIDLQHRRLLLAVDRFCVYPVCFAVEGSRISFSNRADRVPTRVSPNIDLQGILRYLYFHYLPAPDTFFAGVKRLRAAEALEAEAGIVRQRFHWAPRFDEAPKSDLCALREEFMALLEQAVRREIGPVDRTGAFLSGGTDSSTVTGLLGRITGRPPRAYSIGFDAEGYDEMAFARIAARAYGAEHHERYVTPADIVAGIPIVAAAYDQPFGNSSALPAYYCALAAREDGIERILAGDGGDELFGGNARYARQKLLTCGCVSLGH